MSRRSTIAAISLALVIGLSPGALAHDGLSDTGPVSTATVPDLAAVKQYAVASIRARLAKLDRLQATVDSAVHLTALNEAVLDTQIAAFRAGLIAALTQVQASTTNTVEAVKAVLQAANTNFPVRQFLPQKVRLVIGADDVIFAADQMLAGNAIPFQDTFGFHDSVGFGFGFGSGFWMGSGEGRGLFSGFEDKLADQSTVPAVQALPTAEVAALLNQVKVLANKVLTAVLPLTPSTPNFSQVLNLARADLRSARRLLMEASLGTFTNMFADHPDNLGIVKPNDQFGSFGGSSGQFGQWSQFGGTAGETGSMFGSGFGGGFGGSSGGDSWGQSGWFDGNH
jgi:hypothetical protein